MAAVKLAGEQFERIAALDRLVAAVRSRRERGIVFVGLKRGGAPANEIREAELAFGCAALAEDRALVALEPKPTPMCRPDPLDDIMPRTKEEEKPR